MKEVKNNREKNIYNKPRYYLLDGIRGVAMLSMILYHAMWNLVYLYGLDWDWYRLGCEAKMGPSYLWQQSICWSFILLSGFCWPLGGKKLKHGLMVFGAGLLVTAVTLLVMPQNRIIFGVLTLLGSCMLLMIPLDKVLKKISPVVGMGVGIICFVLTRNVNNGYLGFEAWDFLELPKAWYTGWVATYLGFPAPAFFSTDYFSVIPWFFLFLTGYFLFGICQKRGWLKSPVFTIKIPFFSSVGKYSLPVYLVHQPLLYLAGMMIFG